MLADVPLSEHLIIDRQIRRFFDENRAFAEAHPAFVMPPIALMVDAHSSWSYADYKRGGLIAARLIVEMVRTHAPDAKRIYEWGCGPGRIIRHLPDAEFLGPNREYFGSDYNRASVEWCAAYLPGIQFTINAPAPPLPYGSASFDVTYCRSVFTHLSEQSALAWMQELERVTKPGGLICFTTQSDAHIHKLTEPERALYDDGGYVERTLDAEGLRGFSAFHPPRYVRETLIGDRQLLEHRPDHQDLWCIRVGQRGLPLPHDSA